MLPISRENKILLSKTVFIIVLACCCVACDRVPSADAMIINLAKQIPQLMKLVSAVSYVLGLFMMFKGVLAFKQYGESRTMASSHTELKTPLILMICGGGLLFLPSWVQVGLNTFWTHPNPYGYTEQYAGETQRDQFVRAMFQIMQLFGIISFIRGWLILATTSTQSVQPGTFAKGITHIIGGILLFNLYDFINVLKETVSPS